jgi:putative membrane protein
MYTRKHYSFWRTFLWSSKPFFIGLLYAILVLPLYGQAKVWLGIDLSLPWQPVSILGTAVAFYLGFKNNASYDRTWEARKIWGGIVNNSRTFGTAVCAFVQGEKQEQIRKELIYRHVAWMTALRFQLRTPRDWEHLADRVKSKFYPETTDKSFENLAVELQQYLAEEELSGYLGKANVAAQIMSGQGRRLQELRQQGYLDDWRHLEMHRTIGLFYEDQGRSERIKNYPFPRQYASAALWLTFLLAACIPFGILSTIDAIKHWQVMPLLSAIVTWAFFLMEKIGDYSENPFEGSYNDVPITSISRAIEIDLRQMIGDTHPEPIKSENGFLM